MCDRSTDVGISSAIARSLPNELELSCGGRESEEPAAKVLSSSQTLIAKLPAVGFIDWLDRFGMRECK